MKFEAWPVEPPGLGSGPLSSSVMSVSPSWVRWWTRLLPTMPAPMTTTCWDAGSSLVPACALTTPDISDADQRRQTPRKEKRPGPGPGRPPTSPTASLRWDLPVDHVEVHSLRAPVELGAHVDRYREHVHAAHKPERRRLVHAVDIVLEPLVEAEAQ